MHLKRWMTTFIHVYMYIWNNWPPGLEPGHVCLWLSPIIVTCVGVEDGERIRPRCGPWIVLSKILPNQIFILFSPFHLHSLQRPNWYSTDFGLQARAAAPIWLRPAHLKADQGPARLRGLARQGGRHTREEPGPVRLLLGLRHHRADWELCRYCLRQLACPLRSAGQVVFVSHANAVQVLTYNIIQSVSF